jgi:hypothetical protein
VISANASRSNSKRRALRVAVGLSIAIVLLGAVVVVGMHRCRPEAKYQREARLLAAIRPGMPVSQATELLRSEFEVARSGESRLYVTSRLEQRERCSCFPVMANYRVIEVTGGAVQNVSGDDYLRLPAWLERKPSR